MQVLSDFRGNQYWLLSIPGDGDCLFGSLVHQLYGVTPKNALFKPYSRQLRHIAVQEIKSNIEHYYENVVYYANELVLGDMPLAERINAYLNLLDSSGVWAGTESIAAISNHFKVGITVHQDNACMRFSPIEADDMDPQLQIINIFYRGSSEGKGRGGERSHYDSVVCFRPFDFTLSPCQNPTYTSLLYDHDFEAEYVFLSQEKDSLWTSVGHQITGAIINENTIYLLRCLVADEYQSLSSDELSAFGVSMEDLDTFLFHLKIGRHDGGKNSLILLASVMQIKIRLHSSDHVSESLAPVESGRNATIDLMRRDNQIQDRYGSVLKVNRRRITTSPVQQDLLEIARKTARVEICATPEVDVAPVVLNEKVGLRFASLNINGCRTVEKQDAIDSLLLTKNVHLAALQEVNLQGTEAVTTNYKWYLGPRSGNKRRGLALLVRVDIDVSLSRQKSVGPNIQMAEVSYRVIIVKSQMRIWYP